MMANAPKPGPCLSLIADDPPACRHSYHIRVACTCCCRGGDQPAFFLRASILGICLIASLVVAGVCLTLTNSRLNAVDSVYVHFWGTFLFGISVGFTTRLPFQSLLSHHAGVRTRMAGNFALALATTLCLVWAAGAAVELLQTFVARHTVELRDVWTNIGGGTAGVLAAAMCSLLADLRLQGTNRTHSEAV
jgi:VanZ family protein